jgi:adenosylmethionine-8-amino-7-oxononanoate aminotransferase
VTRHRYPRSPVFYRDLRRDYPVAVRGEGVWITDQHGKRYLDAAGGAFVVNVGHGIAEIAAAMARQAETLAYVNGTAFTHDAAEELARGLVELTPAFDKVYILSSGSEAVEAALKLARQHWLEVGRPSKHRVIALTPSYHGNTLLALSASARGHYRTAFGDWLVEVHHVPAPQPYRCDCAGSPSCATCSGSVLEQAILELGSESVAAFIAEPVGGSSTGAVVPRDDYWRTVRAICDRHDVLFVADEVLSGAGRTGTWTAIERCGVAPDIMTMGKGIAGGYAPLSVVLTSRRVVEPIAEGKGALLHAQTFSFHPVACAAGVATLAYLRAHALVARAATIGAVLHERLEPLRRLPNVGDVRGRGLLACLELVENTETKAPFARVRRMAERVTHAAQEEGLIVWPNVGHADGTNGDLLLLAPPFVITEDEIDETVTRLEKALTRAIADA